jgi:hypothetical protein
MSIKNNQFEFNIQWRKATDYLPELTDTTGDLTIRLNDRYATRHYDILLNTTVDQAFISAYPLALWVAYYWWRLNYEPDMVNDTTPPSYRWKSAHDMPAAGFGYIWPPIRFISDGNAVSVIVLPAFDKMAPAYIQYTSPGWRQVIPQSQFETVLNDFINNTIARLDATGNKETELHALWRDVCGERHDTDSNFYRILEACLGHDLGEGPEDLIERLIEQAGSAGRQPMIELAAGLSTGPSDRLAPDLAEDLLNLQGTGLAAKFNHGDFQPRTGIDNELGEPWEIGRTLAGEFRDYLNLGQRPLSNAWLSESFEMRINDIVSSNNVSPFRNMSLGVPDDDRRLKIHLHRPEETARRFYLSRILGERLLNTKQPGDWLPATYGRTWRQKFQRAFAAEFLCPLKVLEERLSPSEPDDEYDVVNIAKEYGMTEKAVKTHWDRNRPPVE